MNELEKECLSKAYDIMLSLDRDLAVKLSTEDKLTDSTKEKCSMLNTSCDRLSKRLYALKVNAILRNGGKI